MAEATALPAEAAALGHVRALVARSGSSFLWGMRVLPPERRDAMYAVYAFCREVDDIVDEPAPAAVQREQLAAWRAEIARLYDGRPTFPVARALLGPVRRFALPREEFLAVIDGMAMDIGDAMRAPDAAELDLYCRRVAGAVGLISIRVFGADEPEAAALAVSLGRALQLTNILRDLAEDAARGRLYLPRERLAAHGIADFAPAAVLAHPALPAVCAEMAAAARADFAESRALMRRCDRRRLRAPAIMLETYSRLLDRLEARGWRADGERVSLGLGTKLWILARYGLLPP